MTPITETNTFSNDVNRYDTTDPVLGGEAGESNDPIIALASRTRYLKNYINGYDGIISMTGSGVINNGAAGKLVYIVTSANMTATIAPSSGFLVGQKVAIKTKTTGVKSIRITPDGSDVIIGIPAPLTALWLHDNEYIELVKVASNTWELLDIDTNLSICGNDAMVRRMPKNAAVAIGTSGVLRADVARLWDIINSQNLSVAEATWTSDLVNYRSCYSSGNGTTTLRLPDMRSMVWRGLDMGRNVDTTRLGTIAGSYAPDLVKAHTHGLPMGDGALAGVAGYIPDQNPRDGNIRRLTGSVDANGTAVENTVKNVGLTPVIYY